MRFEKKLSYKAAVYLRLSRDDGDKAESDSIHNQRELIKEFLKKHPEIKSTREFVDDGYSGTNFERPAFIRMMKEIENRKIDCVVVKDLSRMGRNYIETGKYLERVFPMYGVRFLSVNDNYDSTNENGDAEQIVIPFKNLLNDAYCRDISIKVRSQLDVKRKQGLFIGSFACYGYKKHPKNRNKLIIDEYAAGIVREIFNMKLEGYSAGRIAEKLNERNVLTPFEYKRSCGLNYNSGYHLNENPKWMASSVTSILTNEIYTGTCVQGKIQKINYKVKACRTVAPEEWIRVEDTHEAIIPKNVFDSVQELLKLDTRVSPGEDKVAIFSGLLRCGSCGQNMAIRKVKKKGKTYTYYHCTTYKNKAGCTSHLINVERLHDVVLEQVQIQLVKLCEAEKILQMSDSLQISDYKLKSMEEQLQKLDLEIKRYAELKEKLYQDLVDKIVTKEEYDELSQRFTMKMKSSWKAKQDLEEQKSKLNLGNVMSKSWIDDFRQYGEIVELDRKVVVSLIEKIVVYDKNNIEICFRYGDEMGLMIACAEEYEERMKGAFAV